MFPSNDSNWIRKILIQSSFNIDDEKLLFEIVVDNILHGENNEMNNLSSHTPGASNIFGNIDDRFTYLENVLPNADPNYLYQIAAECESYDDIHRFVEESLIHHLYPTKDDRKVRVKEIKVKNQYLDDFNVQEFCSIYPEPFAYFENPERRGTFNGEIFKFLEYSFGMVIET